MSETNAGPKTATSISSAPARQLVPATLLALIRQGKVTPFVGAGISMMPPTLLPSASQLAAELIHAGLGKPGEDLEQIAEDCWQASGDERVFVGALPISKWRVRPTNECHKVLAELAAEGLVRTILTTNWDTCLEAALRETGVPYTPIARNEDLATSDATSARVAKLNGCIEQAGTIKARRTDVDSPDWCSEWTKALLASNVLSSSLLFVGYSGASRAATRTIEAIRKEPHSAGLDWVVDRIAKEKAEESERSSDFLSALGVAIDKYLEWDAKSFFEELREQIYPLLLSAPMGQAKTLVENLLGPTSIDPPDIVEAVDQFRESWRALGQSGAQSLLKSAMHRPDGLPYAPVVPTAEVLGRYWAWAGLLLWAGAASLDEAQHGQIGLISVTPAGKVTVLPVLCESDQRRGEACAATVATLLRSGVPATTFLGLAVGGAGPLTAPTSPYSVARGRPRADVARGGAIRILEWQDADSVFDLVSDGIDGTNLAEAIKHAALTSVSGTAVATDEAGR